MPSWQHLIAFSLPNSATISLPFRWSTSAQTFKCCKRGSVALTHVIWPQGMFYSKSNFHQCPETDHESDKFDSPFMAVVFNLQPHWEIPALHCPASWRRRSVNSLCGAALHALQGSVKGVPDLKKHSNCQSGQRIPIFVDWYDAWKVRFAGLRHTNVRPKLELYILRISCVCDPWNTNQQTGSIMSQDLATVLCQYLPGVPSCPFTQFIHCTLCSKRPCCNHISTASCHRAP